MQLIERLKKNLKYVKAKDILPVFLFVVLYPVALIFRLILSLTGKKIWLICESPDTARDNGYQFYKYIRENHKEIYAYYAIEKNSADRKNVIGLGNVIDYGSIKHWIYYLAATENISSQKAGNPAPVLFYILHIYGIIRNNKTFLDHGIVKDDLDWLYYNETKFKLFICGAKSEYEYVKSTFGYPEGSVVYTGLARFDNRYNFTTNRKQILLMPTWRSWLARETNSLDDKNQTFQDTTFYKHWSSLLNNSQLTDYLEENDLTIYFYPHFNMQKYVHLFKTNCKNIKIVSKESIDIQDLLKESSLLVTDFSSVYFDFAYMQKPLIYYQFDEKEFRAKQYKEGYFSYRRDGFGPVLTQEQAVVDKILVYHKNNFDVEEKYQKNNRDFFPLKDQNNSRRIYEAIIASQKIA